MFKSLSIDFTHECQFPHGDCDSTYKKQLCNVCGSSTALSYSKIISSNDVIRVILAYAWRLQIYNRKLWACTAVGEKMLVVALLKM